MKCGLCDKEATHKAGGYIFEYEIDGKIVKTGGILEKPLCDEHFKEFTGEKT